MQRVSKCSVMQRFDLGMWVQASRPSQFPRHNPLVGAVRGFIPEGRIAHQQLQHIGIRRTFELLYA